MQPYNQREINRYSDMNRRRGNQSDMPHEQGSSYGSNFGEHARPYGEDYGEDEGYGRSDVDFNPNRNYGHGRYRQEQNRMGFDYGGYGQRDEEFDRYGRSRVGGYARDTRFDVGSSHDYQRHGGEGRFGRSYPETYRSKESGYMSQENNDRDQWQQHHRGGFGRRNYSDPWFDDRAGGYGDRNWWDKTRDEISSWLGDDEAERRRRVDKMFRGKGPRNYKRSDGRIQDDIVERLTDDHYLDASEIDVSVSNGEVTLTGTVDDRTAKRRAEDIAETVSGVTNVENRLRVSVTKTIIV